MIEERLAEFGILGLWTASLMIDRYVFQNKMTKAIERLTEAIREKF